MNSLISPLVSIPINRDADNANRVNTHNQKTTFKPSNTFFFIVQYTN